ncbi:MAG: restriction endonuclease subunit S [Pirellulaceae bacterium]
MKDSGIEWLGMVPKHWEVKVLRRFNCKVQTGPFGSQLHAEEYISGGTPVVNPTHMVNGSIVPSDEITVSDNVLARLPHQRLEVGDVIFSRRGELGRCALVTETEVGWLCGTGSMILRLHHSEYIGGYLSLFLSLDVLRQYFESFSIGTVMDSLSSETLLAMPLVVPPINEQLFIVQFVATQSAVIDSLVAAAKLAVDLLQERRTALISAAVTGKIDVRCHGEPSASNRMSYEAQLS